MKNIKSLYQEWKSLLPLRPEDQKRLDQKFKLEFNYNSNHLEGNTLTYGQTKLLFMFGETSGSATIRDYEEMKAHDVGLEMMKQEAIDLNKPLTESFIRQLNQTILVEDFWKEATTPSGQPTRMEVKVGQYKTRPNSVITATGETFEYASPEETPALMSDLVDWYNTEERKGELSSIELASLLHYRYIRIHPFEDGNGRVARLLVNYVLYRHHYPMIVVKSDDKKSYLRILHECDIRCGLIPSLGVHATLEQIEPFVEYMTTQLERALEISIRAAKGESIEEEDDFAKQMAILKKRAQEKNNSSEKKQFSPEEVWNVLEYFYFPLEKRLIEELKPAQDFFSELYHVNRLSKNKAYTFTGQIERVERNTTDQRLLDSILHTRSIWFTYLLNSPKREYNIPESFEINIQFPTYIENDHYVVTDLDNKAFDYGTYPSEEEVAFIISSYKKKVLEQIEEIISKNS